MDVYTVLEAPHLKRRIPLPDCLLTSKHMWSLTKGKITSCAML
jgi:hypothetical protein